MLTPPDYCYGRRREPSQPQRLADKGKPGVTRGRKATGLGFARVSRVAGQEVGVATARPRLDALVRVLAVAALAYASIASVRPI